MSRANTTFSAQCGQPQCAELNTELLTRTFLVGNAISLADLIVFGSIYPTTVRSLNRHLPSRSLALALPLPLALLASPATHVT